MILLYFWSRNSIAMQIFRVPFKTAMRRRVLIREGVAEEEK